MASHVGTALIKRDGGSGELLTAWARKRRLPEWAETEIERQVSEYIGRMPFRSPTVPTDLDGTSLRGYIERNSIAPLSNRRDAPDRPSGGWLGQHAESEKVRDRDCGTSITSTRTTNRSSSRGSRR
ncbi:hypothetical protein [Amycolatopsis sp. cmx-11-51]|uniref:hypothetical protein n=1 Tax=unclassified Amycolatopsis TaxID=2618356 RepID=UPI0039E3AA23